jgi:hypothetical protein
MISRTEGRARNRRLVAGRGSLATRVFGEKAR